MDRFEFKFDIHKKELIADCRLQPTQVKKSDTSWLYAINNKYSDDCIDDKKTGKWMLFLSKYSANVIWNKIKMAIAEGDLWQAKVSTANPEKSSYAVMIYTKDYTDLPDVVQVLDYLETSEIKPASLTIKYKTDEQTRAGIYRGGSQKAWIYSSDTVRTIGATQRNEAFFWRERSPSSHISGSSASENSASFQPN